MIRVLIVDNALNEKNGWMEYLTGQPEIAMAAAATGLAEGLERIDQCDVLLVSTSLPDDGAYHLTQRAARTPGCIQVIILGKNEPPAALLRYFETGALGYVPLDSEPEALYQHILSVYRGEAALPPALTTALLRRLSDLAAWVDKMGFELEHARTLTRREHEILDLLGRNFTNQDIADHLIIEVGTVKNHVHNILAKLKVSSRREAASYLALLRNRQAGGHHWLPARSPDGYRRHPRPASHLMQDQA
jgi:two-component system nitrate/nitrite response regulator NarL